MLVRLPLTRRDVLQKALALGVVTVASPFSGNVLLSAFEEKELRSPTPPNELGPFYKKRSPTTKMLRISGDPGMPLTVAGGAYNTRGEKVVEASVEVWQTDHFGHYDIEGYRYRAKLKPDASANYSFDSIMPGHYPSRVCQHIHYLVIAPGHKPLITQLYFATDPVFEGDPDKNFQRDPLIHSRELVRPVMLTGDPKDIHAAVNFDVVLERL
jgi:protocatechuate 3,4-dioxygenase beta subunit